jgi:hypothetical protein
MCYISRKIYTVCAHSSLGELIECRVHKDKRAKWPIVYTGLCVARGLSFWRCRSRSEATEIVYGFCPNCRDFYRGFNTRDVSAILNYWAFKNRHGYSTCVPATMISADEVFGQPPPLEESLKQPRCELIALGNQLPPNLKLLDSPVDWLRRLEGIRKSTLEWAEQGPRRKMPIYWAANVKVRGGYDSTLCIQPRINSPMSVYPHPSAPSSLQCHGETYRKLCGEDFSLSSTLWMDGTAEGSDNELVFDMELETDTPATTPEAYPQANPGIAAEPNLTSRFSLDSDSTSDSDESDLDFLKEPWSDSEELPNTADDGFAIPSSWTGTGFAYGSSGIVGFFSIGDSDDESEGDEEYELRIGH